MKQGRPLFDVLSNAMNEIPKGKEIANMDVTYVELTLKAFLRDQFTTVHHDGGDRAQAVEKLWKCIFPFETFEPSRVIWD